MEYSSSHFNESVQKILQSATVKEEIEAAQKLANSYSLLFQHSEFQELEFKTDETNTSAGVALAPTAALACLDDPLRTIRFIKGIYTALKDAREKFNQQCLEVLYAGCGPAAPLLIPLLSLFKEEELSISLLDIHQNSINSLKKITSILGCQNKIREFIVADATSYTFPKEIPLHIIVTETMDKALTKEPQLNITQNLAPQLVADGILIPVKISLYCDHGFFAKRNFFNDIQDLISPKSENQISTEYLLFSIDKRFKSSKAFSFESHIINRPEFYEDCPDICIFTEITIYKEFGLTEGESLITNPYCVGSYYTNTHKQYTLKYLSKPNPKWIYKKVKG